MNNTKLNNFNLVLTIGTNPLPCLVTSKYLLKQNYNISKIYLIYSEHNNNQQGTKDYADRLKELIERDFSKIAIELISLSNVGSATQIEKDLGKVQWNKNSAYHLNYTGGTKTMSVHVHRFFKEKFTNVKYSYLDTRSYLLKYDDGTYEPFDGDLRNKVFINIQDLIKLHGYDITNSEKVVFQDVLDEFNEGIKNNKIKEFFQWYQNTRYIKSSCDLSKKNKFLETINKEFPLSIKSIVKNFGNNIPDIAKNILDTFPKDRQIHIVKNGIYELWIPEDKMGNDDFKKRIKHTWEYLDGKWLEHYIYDKLKSKLEQKDLDEGESFGWSLLSINEAGKNFELDFYIIKGYQLIGISITTDDQTYICKSKGFEVIHRTRQIGGDESCAILITALNENQVRDLADDLRVNTGTNEERFKVFGINDWKDIDSKILNYINL